MALFSAAEKGCNGGRCHPSHKLGAVVHVHVHLHHQVLQYPMNRYMFDVMMKVLEGDFSICLFFLQPATYILILKIFSSNVLCLILCGAHAYIHVLCMRFYNNLSILSFSPLNKDCGSLSLNYKLFQHHIIY